MSEYVCKVGTGGGRVVEKVYQAENEQALRKDLQDRDFHVFSIRKRGIFALSLGGLLRLGRGRKKVGLRDFLVFNQEFAALIKAGMPILHSLSLLAERVKDPTFKNTLLGIRDDVESGTSLSEAFSSQGGFSRVYTASLMAGERSGDLVGVVKRFIDYLKILMNVRRRIFSAMVYPALLICLSLVLISIMILVVIPKFEEFYADFDAELPLVTQFLLVIADFFAGNILYIILGVVIVVVAAQIYDRTPAGGVVIDRLKLKIPVLGTLLRHFSISQLTRTLATLLSGGIPLVTSLEVASKAVGNRLISREASAVVGKINEGESLADSLERTGLFTDLTVEMVKVGETSGALTEMLTNVADFYDEEVDNRISTIIAMLEPLLLISMGLVIAGMLLAMYLPLFESINTVRG